MRLLLHTCCATCGAWLAGELAKDFKDGGSVGDEQDQAAGFDVSIFYFNPNIFPFAEYEKRRDEAKKFFAAAAAQKNAAGFDFIEGEYDHEAWLATVKGLESESERGKRCEKCYAHRLGEIARYAAGLSGQAGKFDFFASTLSISPHKSAAMINAAGEAAGREFGVKFLAADFKKCDGFKKANDFSREQGFYRQNYCGCEFSQKVIK